MRISDWSSDVCSSDLQAQAALRQAQIDLRYTDVIAPIAGRIGRSAFTSGALVGPDSGPLALVVSQNPIHVTFPVTQRRSEERRGGKECVSTCRSRLSPDH